MRVESVRMECVKMECEGGVCEVECEGESEHGVCEGGVCGVDVRVAEMFLPALS